MARAGQMPLKTLVLAQSCDRHASIRHRFAAIRNRQMVPAHECCCADSGHAVHDRRTPNKTTVALAIRRFFTRSLTLTALIAAMFTLANGLP
jgi:hypothetical protein